MFFMPCHTLHSWSAIHPFGTLPGELIDVEQA